MVYSGNQGVFTSFFQHEILDVKDGHSIQPDILLPHGGDRILKFAAVSWRPRFGRPETWRHSQQLQTSPGHPLMGNSLEL